jgi:hypothetical protein
MYKIEKRKGGLALPFGDTLSKEELVRWFKESEQALTKCRGPFGVIIDMRTLKLLPPDAQAVMVQGQSLYKKAGMERSAVLLLSPVMTVQFKRLGKESGIYAFERYIDASSDAHWQKHAADW